MQQLFQCFLLYEFGLRGIRRPRLSGAVNLCSAPSLGLRSPRLTMHVVTAPSLQPPIAILPQALDYGSKWKSRRSEVSSRSLARSSNPAPTSQCVKVSCSYGFVSPVSEVLSPRMHSSPLRWTSPASDCRPWCGSESGTPKRVRSATRPSGRTPILPLSTWAPPSYIWQRSLDGSKGTPSRITSYQYVWDSGIDHSDVVFYSDGGYLR